MNTSNLIPPALAVLILLVLAALFVLSYTNNFQRRLAMMIDLPPRRLRNLLLALAAMCFLLLNPLIHAILIAAGIFLYRYLIRSEKDAVIANTKRNSFFYTELVCKPTNQTSEADPLAALRKCLFASFYVVSASESDILIEGGAYKLNVTLFSEKYLNSFIHFLGESGFTTINNKQNKNQGLKGSMFTENAL